MDNEMTETVEENRTYFYAISDTKKRKLPVSTIHPKVLKLDDEDVLSYVSVYSYIQNTKELISTMLAKSRKRATTEKAKNKLEMEARHKTAYISQMNHYLKSGDWIADHFGKDEEVPTVWTCRSLGHDANGNVKRIVNVYYHDLNDFWTLEMDKTQRELNEKSNLTTFFN